MATAKIFPKTSQVTGTHSNMPLLLIPSLVPDIGSLTLAQAQSIRIYTDSGLTTEVAREIVSANEIHFKAPSASSSMEFWVDWDGVRADYAVTDTYGRNAVWSDYGGVWHMQEATTAIVDSTGNAGNGSTSFGTPTMQNADAPFGLYSVALTNDEITVPHAASQNFGTGDATYQMWVKEPGSTYNQLFFKRTGVSDYTDYVHLHSDFRVANDRYRFMHKDGGSLHAPVTNAAEPSGWMLLHAVRTGTTRKEIFRNASALSGDTSGTSINGDTTGPIYIGANSLATFDVREFRMRGTAFSSDWITTEYNNQNDNAAFWDSDPVGGGGGVVAPQFIGFAGL